MTRVLSIGECMIELTHQDADTLSLGVAGDTFNTAAYLARLTTVDDVRIDYLTMLGEDYYSGRILDVMRSEGIGTGLIGRSPDAKAGLYLVRTDDSGERWFTYYRSQSAARRLFVDYEPVDHGYDVVYLSAISLQILTSAARQRLFALLRGVRERGGKVVFDSNYRAAGWSDLETAQDAVRTAWEITSIALPTFSDEQALFGDATPEATVGRLRSHGVGDIVVKDGARGCVAWAGTDIHTIPAEPVDTVVDSTAAGDAFNAGYLAARLTGSSQADAARRANTLAAQVIQHPGAIVGEDVLPRRQ